MTPFHFQTRLSNNDCPIGVVRGLGLLVVCRDSTGLVTEHVLFTQDYHHSAACPRQGPFDVEAFETPPTPVVSFVEAKADRGMIILLVQWLGKH